MANRKYELKKRAERQKETRQRIVEAAVYLHQTVGGQAATISAIAEQAGVERLTVYRHFPDERALLTACTAHYLAQHPPPDPTRWGTLAEPEQGLRAALADIYAYHRETEAMMNSTYRDIESVPLLRELLEPFFAYWHEVEDMLADRFPADDDARPLVRAAVGLAVDFLTWRSLIRWQGLDDAQAVEVMVAMVTCLSRQG